MATLVSDNSITQLDAGISNPNRGATMNVSGIQMAPVQEVRNPYVPLSQRQSPAVEEGADVPETKEVTSSQANRLFPANITLASMGAKFSQGAETLKNGAMKAASGIGSAAYHTPGAIKSGVSAISNAIHGEEKIVTSGTIEGVREELAAKSALNSEKREVLNQLRSESRDARDDAKERMEEAKENYEDTKEEKLEALKYDAAYIAGAGILLAAFPPAGIAAMIVAGGKALNDGAGLASAKAEQLQEMRDARAEKKERLAEIKEMRNQLKGTLRENNIDTVSVHAHNGTELTAGVDAETAVDKAAVMKQIRLNNKGKEGVDEAGHDITLEADLTSINVPGSESKPKPATPDLEEGKAKAAKDMRESTAQRNKIYEATAVEDHNLSARAVASGKVDETKLESAEKVEERVSKAVEVADVSSAIRSSDLMNKGNMLNELRTRSMDNASRMKSSNDNLRGASVSKEDISRSTEQTRLNNKAQEVANMV